MRLLHFAPEQCFYDILSRQHNIEYLPCDRTPEFYKFKGAIEVQRVDITQMTFQDNYFDIILCNHVLEHIPDDALAMAELKRVMKKDGWGIFQVPIDYDRATTYEDFSVTTREERLKVFGQEDHVRWYGRDYKDRLQTAGFIVTEDDYVGQFSSEEVFQFGLMSSELIYHCKRPI